MKQVVGEDTCVCPICQNKAKFIPVKLGNLFSPKHRTHPKKQNEPKSISRVLGFLGSWVLEFLDSWVLGFLGSWILGFLDSWIHVI